MNIKKLVSLIAIFTLLFLIIGTLNAWTGPTEAPPGGNVDEPLNTSNQTQTKYGYLYFPKWFDSNNDGYYLDPDGNSWLNRLYSHDIRASIFYDVDNTSFYLDPNGTSVLNNIVIEEKIKSALTSNLDTEDTLVTKSYITSATTYNACAWYSGTTCPVEEDIQTLLAGYTSSQVYCCGKTAASCDPYDWTTYDSYCTASGSCGTVYGIRKLKQRKRESNCLLSYREIDGGSCSVYFGQCPSGYYCSGGSCLISPCSCFVYNTQVTMADGTYKNIQDVKIGEKVKGLNSSINTVIGLDRPSIGSRGTFIVNNSVEMTGEHPMLSTDGIKVADLELFYEHKESHGRYNNIEEPTKLEIGDILITDEGFIEVKSIVKSLIRPSNEIVYDLLVDGNHTYIADGFVVSDSE